MMTEAVLRKLESGFLLGFSDKEACFYAGIGTTALYDYQKRTTGYAERKEAFKQQPAMTSKTTMAESVKDPKWASWYLERKCKDEFSQRTEHTSKNLSIEVKQVIPPEQMKRASKEILKVFKEMYAQVSPPSGKD